MNLRDFGSGSTKSCRSADTRNNWVMFMLVSHKRKNVFRKESHQQACERGFRKLEHYGFRFGSIGFGGTHVHLAVDVPKRYSVTQAEIMLKRFSAVQMFAEKPNFLKLYPDRHFWSGYEHHQSIGREWNAADVYIRNQEMHHGIEVIHDVPRDTPTAPRGDTAGSSHSSL